MVLPPATSKAPRFVERETADKFCLEPNRSVIQATQKRWSRRQRGGSTSTVFQWEENKDEGENDLLFIQQTSALSLQMGM